MSARAPKASAAERLDPLQIVDASFLAGAGPGSQLPAPTSAEIAFAGRSNVGKSSLINTLIERKGLVRTSSKPGSTRQINLYEARARDGAVFHLIDLPGYGFTLRSKAETASWGDLIEGYLRERVTLAAVVLLVDVRRGLEPDDLELVAFIDSVGSRSRRPVDVIVVATKLDKVPRSAQRSALDKVAKQLRGPAPAAGATPGAAAAVSGEARTRPGARREVIGFSSETGEGKRALWLAIRRIALGSAPASPAQDG